MTTEYVTRASGNKKEYVTNLTKEIDNSKVVAVIDLNNLPSKQLQGIRNNVDSKLKIRMAKKTLLSLALKNSKIKNSEKLIEYFDGMPALVLFDDDSFNLWTLLKENMSDSLAKAGQLAPFDIIIPAGPTGFAPGPILGELGDVGIKAGINAGKIEVKQDSKVVSEGEEISAKLAAILSRLDVRPMKLGLNLIASLEDGTIYLKSTLDVDPDEYIEKIKSAYSDAFKLGIGANIVNSETIKHTIQNAEMDSIKLAYSQDILVEKTKSLLLSKAEAEASALNKKVVN
ncbi:MAG: 50S ribosomal protein L10 [Candidatus Woesearchaeota archaeon]